MSYRFVDSLLTGPGWMSPIYSIETYDERPDSDSDDDKELMREGTNSANSCNI
jgi:hypothetical protein